MPSRGSRRGYGQYCALAKALDVIGDRWTLLIVRELLVRGPSRYTDIRNGLPGIATNLLVERLNGLEAAGLIVREAAPLPVATTLLRLTARGEALRDVVNAIGRWGGPLLANADPADAVCSHWLALPIELHLRDRMPTRPPVRIELRTGGEPLVIETVDGRVRARLGRADERDGVITGPPRAVLALLMGKLTPAGARREGVRYEGALSALRRLASVTPDAAPMPARRVSRAAPVTGRRRARPPTASR
jgi:DNA-binding HxlR family transcriptional regulator